MMKAPISAAPVANHAGAQQLQKKKKKKKKKKPPIVDASEVEDVKATNGVVVGVAAVSTDTAECVAAGIESEGRRAANGNDCNGDEAAEAAEAEKAVKAAEAEKAAKAAEVPEAENATKLAKEIADRATADELSKQAAGKLSKQLADELAAGNLAAKNVLKLEIEAKALAAEVEKSMEAKVKEAEEAKAAEAAAKKAARRAISKRIAFESTAAKHLALEKSKAEKAMAGQLAAEKMATDAVSALASAKAAAEKANAETAAAKAAAEEASSESLRLQKTVEAQEAMLQDAERKHIESVAAHEKEKDTHRLERKEGEKSAMSLAKKHEDVLSRLADVELRGQAAVLAEKKFSSDQKQRADVAESSLRAEQERNLELSKELEYFRQRAEEAETDIAAQMQLNELQETEHLERTASSFARKELQTLGFLPSSSTVSISWWCTEIQDAVVQESSFVSDVLSVGIFGGAPISQAADTCSAVFQPTSSVTEPSPSPLGDCDGSAAPADTGSDTELADLRKQLERKDSALVEVREALFTQQRLCENLLDGSEAQEKAIEELKLLIRSSVSGVSTNAVAVARSSVTG